MAAPSLYRDGRKEVGMPGYVVPPSHERATADSSGVVFETQRPVPHNIVELDPATGLEVVRQISADALSQLAHRNRNASGVRDKNTAGYSDVVKEPPLNVSSQRAPGVQLTLKEGAMVSKGPVIETITPLAVSAPAPVPSASIGIIPANKPIQELPKDLDLEPNSEPGPKRISSYEVPVRKSTDEPPPEPLIKPSYDDGTPPNGNGAHTEAKASSANSKSAPMQLARVKVRFISPMGKLAVPYNVVFQDGISLVLVQYSPEGMFYDPPECANEHIEVQWHGRMFMCLPGVHFVMPDQQTAFTVFLIDEGATRKREEEERERKGHYLSEADKVQ
jgi:hypothetical protein